MATVAWALACLAPIAGADPAASGAAPEIPELSRPVHDLTQSIPPSEVAALEGMIREFGSRANAQLGILITPSLEGRDIESYSLAVAEKWKLGRKGADRGLLLVLAPKDGQARLEVGYGLEGDITDAFSKQVLDDVMVPYFRKAQFGMGLMAGVQAIAKKLNVEIALAESASPPRKPERSRSANGGGPGLWFALVALFLILSALNRMGGGRRHYYRGGGRRGGFGGGGFGGFGSGGSSYSGGGGSFGGGGASSRW
ncbi:MAG: YgcG family protein [Bacteriovoracia bacterium]